MASPANVRSIAALDDMKSALKRFQSEAQSVLRSTGQEIQRTLEWLQERLNHWRYELKRRQQALNEAQRALQACLRSGDRDHPPDCRQQQAYVWHMQRLVQEAEQELRIVMMHMKRVEEAIKNYEVVARRFSGTLNEELLQGSAFLSSRSNILNTYASGGSRGSSYGGIDNIYHSGMNNADTISAAISKALQSSKPDNQLPGIVANWVKDDVVSFQRKIGPNGSIGEIDVETSKAIIEVTISRLGKAHQIRERLTNPRINPEGKPVILFAPNYTQNAAQHIIGLGAHIAHTKEELLDLLRKLGGS
jgi:tetratricopeptide (TPR) repeat protein